MAGPIHQLDPSIGIQDLLAPTSSTTLPKPRNLAASTFAEAGLEELYAPSNAKTLIENALRPPTGDGTLLQPAVFTATLESCVQALMATDNPQCHALAAEELQPLLQNKQLLQAYTGLMIGG